MNSIETKPMNETKHKVTPRWGWASLALSAFCLLAAFGIKATSPHENFVAAYAGLLLCGFGSVIGFFAGILSLFFGERPKLLAATGMVLALPALLLLLALLTWLGVGRIESGF
jgi:hypothetical protein